MRQEWVGKRQSVRTVVQLRAQIRSGPNRAPIDCMVKDISATGARIVLPSDAPCPAEFDIFIPARSETKWVRVRWREKRQLGVQFMNVRPGDPDGAADAILERVIRLEDRLTAEASEAGAIQLPKSSEAAGADLGALAALEERLAVLEAQRAAPALAESGLNAILTPLIDQLAALEQNSRRLAVQIQELKEQGSAAATKLRVIEARSEKLDASSTRPQPESAEQRLRAVETSVSEVRAALRTLVLLMSSRFKAVAS